MLNGKNLALEAEVLKLREKMADRHLNVDQQRSIIGKLSRFSGQRVNIMASAEGTEPSGIAKDISRALGSPDGAGWIVSNQFGQEFGVVVPGIGIEIQQDASPESVSAGRALLKALTDERLEVGEIPALPPGNGRAGAYSGNKDVRAKIMIFAGKTLQQKIRQSTNVAGFQNSPLPGSLVARTGLWPAVKARASQRRLTVPYSL